MPKAVARRVPNYFQSEKDSAILSTVREVRANPRNFIPLLPLYLGRLHFCLMGCLLGDWLGFALSPDPAHVQCRQSNQRIQSPENMKSVYIYAYMLHHLPNICTSFLLCMCLCTKPLARIGFKSIRSTQSLSTLPAFLLYMGRTQGFKLYKNTTYLPLPQQ